MLKTQSRLTGKLAYGMPGPSQINPYILNKIIPVIMYSFHLNFVKNSCIFNIAPGLFNAHPRHA